MQARVEDQHGRRDPERHEIGHRVELGAEIGGGFEQASGQAIQHVQQPAPDDDPGREDEVAELGMSFNRMRRSLDKAMEMLQS